jgi:uncharacterized membrane protein YukC
MRTAWKLLKWAAMMLVTLVWVICFSTVDFFTNPSQRRAILKDIKLFLSVPYWILFDKGDKWTDNHNQS